MSKISQPPASLADVARARARIAARRRAAARRRRARRPARPALTPYLVGLLVMLGMLGTFLGMVVTFKGAVFALEGSTDLQAMRSALAEPIKGLGLSFGTSVAGVAASAMLGLMSAIARRERLDVGAAAGPGASPPCCCPSRWCTSGRRPSRSCKLQARALPEVAGTLQAHDGAHRAAQPAAGPATAGAPRASLQREVTPGL
jgi:hypothetical protein